MFQTVEEMEQDLGEKLKRMRLNKNLDQRTLAERAGVSVRALRNLEGGLGSTVQTLLRIVRALGRESWLQTVAPIPTINPEAFTTRNSARLRAAKSHSPSQRKTAKPLTTEISNDGPESVAADMPKLP